jgi:hypothetical protein
MFKKLGYDLSNCNERFWEERYLRSYVEDFPGKSKKKTLKKITTTPFFVVFYKPLQPSLMFAGKAGAYPSEAHFSCSTLG